MTTKEETLRRIAIMQAWCDGGEIESDNGGLLFRPVDDPLWDWDVSNYRIAPKPKRKVKFLAYMDKDDGRLIWDSQELDTCYYTRLPSLDLEAEVDD